MKYILLAVVLLFSACDRSTTPTPKIAVPQREALEKAKGMDQAVQKETEETRKKVEDATR